MADYQELANGWVRHLSSGAAIPPDGTNTEYLAYLDYVAASGVVLPPPPPTEEELREAAKIARASEVEGIIVTTTSGKSFNGDETAQNRMSRAIHALSILNKALVAGTPITLPPEFAAIYQIVDNEYQSVWVLANNTPAYVTESELSEALVLSGGSQTLVWVI